MSPGRCRLSAILADTYINRLKKTKDRQFDTTAESNMIRGKMTLKDILKLYRGVNKFDSFILKCVFIKELKPTLYKLALNDLFLSDL